MSAGDGIESRPDEASHRWNVYFGRRRLGTVMARERNRAIREAIKKFDVLLPDRRRVDVRAIDAPTSEKRPAVAQGAQRAPGRHQPSPDASWDV